MGGHLHVALCNAGVESGGGHRHAAAVEQVPGQVGAAVKIAAVVVLLGLAVGEYVLDGHRFEIERRGERVPLHFEIA